MEKQVFVYLELQGAPHLVGRLWMRMRRDRESATFEYEKGGLTHPERFSLEPALKLGPGPFHTPSDQPLFGAIGDSAPDRWGRVLMRRAERRRAESQGQTPRTLREIDYLLMVDDEARMGALRFAENSLLPIMPLATPTPRRICVCCLHRVHLSAAPARKPPSATATGISRLRNSRARQMKSIPSCGRRWR
jgi:serine/threonine-protein kinase HipA